MNSENIYDTLTEVREEFIIEAKEHRFHKPRKMLYRWGAIAASLILVVGIGSFALWNSGILPIGGSSDGSAAPGSGAGGGGRDESSTVFMSYAGPVFPLSVLGNSDGITAQRDIMFDFSGFGETRIPENRTELSYNDILVTDSFTLTNYTTDDKSVEILYPFAGSFLNLEKLKPRITTTDNALETQLVFGPYSGGFSGIEGLEHDEVNLAPIRSWEDYVSLLSDGSYLSYAMGDFAAPRQTVIVYEFTNVQGDHDSSVAPTLAAEFNLDYEHTKVMTAGFNGAEFDRENGFMRRSFFVPKEGFTGYGNSFYMIIIGDDISNLVIQGYENGGCNEGEDVNHVSADITRYEADFGDILELLLNKFMVHNSGFLYEYEYEDESIDIAMLYRAAVEHLYSYGAMSDNVAWRYDLGELHDVFAEMLSMDRVFYLSADIVIPAGKSVDISVTQIKPASFDFYGAGTGYEGVNGYDMLTKLGSSLHFSGMTAELAGAERIEIIKQNFGFDPTNGILSVTLDVEIPHYYLEVRVIVLDE